MSYPNIPDISPAIEIDRDDITNLLLASVALEELGLAHIINSEAEKIQFVLGTLENQRQIEETPSIDDLLDINNSVNKTLRNIIKYQILLQFKLEDTEVITPETPTDFIEVGSAWSVGTDFGTGNAQYTTLEADETENTVTLGLGNNYIPVGTVHMLRTNSNLEVTISTIFPYVMDQVHLYVSNIVPVQSNPGGFPYQYTVTEPSDYFTSHTFTVDVSDFEGDLLYIAAHARILHQV